MRHLQDWLADVGTDDVPIRPTDPRTLVPFLRDLGGVIVAGQTTEPIRRLGTLIGSTAGSGNAAVIGTGQRIDPISAAWWNGSAAQALDYDDIAPSCVSHLGAVMVPAVLSVVEEVGADAAMDGLIVGLAAVDRLAEAFTHEVYDRGLQPTHTMGTLGAVIALSRALGLDRSARHAAVGLAATQAIGLRSHTGSEYKPIQAGIVSAAAVRSALMARAGLTAGTDAIEVVMRLLGITDAELGELTRPGELGPVPLATKAFPTCGANHTSIEATLRARADAGVGEGDAPEARIHVTVPPRVMVALTFDHPDTADQARFSMHHCVAAAWVHGRLEPEHFTPEALTDPQVVAARQRVTVTTDDSLTPPPNWSGFPAIIEVTTDAGTTITREERPLGYPERPLSPEGYRDKFLVCTTPTLGDDAARDAYEALGGPDVLGRLGEVLTPASNP